MSDENWGTFVREEDDAPIFVFADLGLMDAAPVTAAPVCTRVELDLPQTAEGELDWETAEAIDDSLESVPAVRAGRTTRDGVRVEYFYSDDGGAAEAAVAAAMAGVPQVRWSASSDDDAEWSLYEKHLRPTLAEWAWMQDQKVLHALRNDGDDGTAARPVTHWAYFPDAAAASRYAEQAEPLGFTAPLNGPAGDSPEDGWPVRLEKTQPLADGQITESTLRLRVLAERCGGDYDGWETEFVPSGG